MTMNPQTVNEASDGSLTCLAINANATDAGITDVAAFGRAFRAALVARGYGETTTDEIPEGDWLASINEAMRSQSTEDSETWTSESYWDTVLGGVASADQLVAEYELVESDIDAWLYRAEAEAWSLGGSGGEQPAEWATFHPAALARLTAAAKRTYGRYDAEYTALALRGLTIRRAGRWTLVDDGHDVWLTSAELSVSPATTEQEMLRRKQEIDEGDDSEAYTDLCDHLCDHVAMSASREAGICNEADVLEAVRAGLFGGDDARIWWGAGELVDGIWAINGERVDDDGNAHNSEVSL